MAAAEIGSSEVGLVQRVAVEPHLTGRSVQVLPEGERQVEVIADVDQAVEGESQLVVLQELERACEIGVRLARQVGTGVVEVATGPVPAGVERLTINGHGVSVAGAVRQVTLLSPADRPSGRPSRGGTVLLGRQTEHRFEGRVLLALDRREEAVRDGAGGRGEEAGQDLGLGGRGEAEGGEEAVADLGVVRVVLEVVGVERGGTEAGQGVVPGGEDDGQGQGLGEGTAMREAWPSESV